MPAAPPQLLLSKFLPCRLRRFIYFRLHNAHVRIEHRLGDFKHARLGEILGKRLVARDITELGMRRQRRPHRAVADLDIGISLPLQLNAFFPLQLAVLLQEPTSLVHTGAHRTDFFFGDYPLDDTETLNAQRL